MAKTIRRALAKPARKRAPLKIADSALYTPAPKVQHRVKLALPELPPGVRPSNAMAMDDAQNYAPAAWSNGYPGLGCGLFFPGYPYLAELSQRPEYRSPTETIAEEMTRKWITLESTGESDVSDKIKEMEKAFREFGIQDLFRKATEVDGYFGRAHLFVDIKGQENARNTPLVISPETIPEGSLTKFKVIEPMWCTPVAWNAIDPTADDFYKPTHWYVLGRDVHASRLIPFMSREVPDLLKPSYNFGGLSLSQMLEKYVNQWLQTKDSVSDLIHNFSIVVLSTNMEAVLSGDGVDDLRKRAAMFIQDRDNRGLMLTDKETELLTQIAVPLGTLDALQAQAQEHMAAVTRIPLVKAFGISPTGLNASSEFEILVFYDHIAARQEIGYTANLRKVNHIIQCHLFGTIDESIEAVFQPMKELDGEALGRVRKGDAELAATLIGSGVISPEEERGRIASDPDSGYSNLDVSAVPDPADLPQNQGAQGEGGNDDDGEE
jgi:phage-related protein (TIGR01555 family)